MMSHWNTQISPWQVTGPVILQGIGTGLVFPQLSAISLGAVPRERMGYASSLFNMMRNTGAAIGISMLTAHLRQPTSKSISRVLAEHFSIFDAWRMSEQPRRLPGSPAFSMLQMQTGHNAGVGDGLRQCPVAGRGAGLQRHLPDAGGPVAPDGSVLLSAPQRADDRDGEVRPLIKEARRQQPAPLTVLRGVGRQAVIREACARPQ